MAGGGWKGVREGTGGRGGFSSGGGRGGGTSSGRGGGLALPGGVGLGGSAAGVTMTSGVAAVWRGRSSSCTGVVSAVGGATGTGGMGVAALLSLAVTGALSDGVFSSRVSDLETGFSFPPFTDRGSVLSFGCVVAFFALCPVSFLCGWLPLDFGGTGVLVFAARTFPLAGDGRLLGGGDREFRNRGDLLLPRPLSCSEELALR